MAISRLYRKTKSIGTPIFTLYTPNYSAYDADIISVTINRGASEPTGYSPSTLEIEVAGAVTAQVNGQIGRLSIRDLPAQRLAALAGIDPATISTRFNGRMATTEVNDRATKRQTTTLTASSWMSQMGYSRRTITPSQGWDIKRVFQEALGALNNGVPRGITPLFYGTFDTVARTPDQASGWRDLLDSYGTGLGIPIRETRGGDTQFFTLEYLDTYLRAVANRSVPLGRHQAISPAKWQQNNERPPADQRFQVTNENGFVVTREFKSTSTTGEIVEVDENDWSHIKADTAQTSNYARKLAYLSSNWRFMVPSVTIDLTMLLDYGDDYSRSLACYLLQLEVFDPIGFSNDWPSRVRGFHCVTGITEKITADGWTLELSLVPWVLMLGLLTTPPTPTPITWDQAAGTWDQAAGTWDSPNVGG